MFKSFDHLSAKDALKINEKSALKIPIFHVDAFTEHVFSGNPAAVCVLPHWLSDEELNSIARENNLPVTAFLVHKSAHYEIRWITPEYELELCGHGSLAAAYIIFHFLEAKNTTEIILHSKIHAINVKYDGNFISMQFPAVVAEPYTDTALLKLGLGNQPTEVYQYKKERLLAVFKTENEVQNLKPDFSLLKKLEHRAVVVTAPSKNHDFVSRTFYPNKLNVEDSVTGASHCLLAPYWAKRYGKKILNAYQSSARGGYLKCELQGDHVIISSKAKLYSQGHIEL